VVGKDGSDFTIYLFILKPCFVTNVMCDVAFVAFVACNIACDKCNIACDIAFVACNIAFVANLERYDCLNV
jgi:hypothetical protein